MAKLPEIYGDEMRSMAVLMSIIIKSLNNTKGEYVARYMPHNW